MCLGCWWLLNPPNPQPTNQPTNQPPPHPNPPTPSGICEYAGVDPGEIDILMGTFTKSFGGMGGYIAGDAALIAHLRRASAGSIYHNSLSTVVTAQVSGWAGPVGFWDVLGGLVGRRRLGGDMRLID